MFKKRRAEDIKFIRKLPKGFFKFTVGAVKFAVQESKGIRNL